MTPPAQWSVGSDPAASPWNQKSEPNVQAWNQKSDPNAQPWHGGSSPNVARHNTDASAPFPRQVIGPEPSQPMPAMTMDVRPKRKWPLVLGAVALLGIGGAIAAVAVNRTEDTKQSTQSADEVKMATPPAKVEAQPPIKTEPEVKTPPVEVKTPAAEVKTPPVEVKAETKQDPSTKKHPITTPPKTPKQTTQAVTKTVKKEPEVKKDAPPPVETAPQKPKCDPFASMHNCDSK
jgi:hypothetical protein